MYLSNTQQARIVHTNKLTIVHTSTNIILINI